MKGLGGDLVPFAERWTKNIDDLLIVIHACFVLHNFCEINNDYIPQEDVDRTIQYNNEFQPPTSSPGRQQSTEAQSKK